MRIFETERFVINQLEQKDKKHFFELLSNPEIIAPIPQKEFSEVEILENLRVF